jgi:hypothetical protein
MDRFVNKDNVVLIAEAIADCVEKNNISVIECLNALRIFIKNVIDYHSQTPETKQLMYAQCAFYFELLGLNLSGCPQQAIHDTISEVYGQL